jgi:nitrite reductase (NO-forming)
MPAQEIGFVQCDFHFKDNPDGSGSKGSNYQMLGHGVMGYVAFNGHTTQYVDESIKVRAGELIRTFVVNARPNVWSSFHVVGGVFDSAYLNANPANKFTGLQSMTIGSRDGACAELTIKEPGIYPAVNRAFGRAAHGAIALLHAEQRSAAGGERNQVSPPLPGDRNRRQGSLTRPASIRRSGYAYDEPGYVV